MTADANHHVSPHSGNRCGHDPSAPRWFEPPAEHAERPPIIRKWIERAKGFYDHPEKIPTLARILCARRLAADPGGDHKPRRMRSERREACCALLGAIAHYCDLPTLCLSVPQPDGALLPIRMETLAERAGLGMRRAERAMRDIVEAGLIAIHRRCERLEDGSYVGRAAIRVVSPAFFGLFGLEGRLEHDRRRISQQRAEGRRQAPNRTASARIKLGVQALGRVLGGGPMPVPAAAHIPELVPAAALPFHSPTPRTHADHIDTMRAILTGRAPRHPSGSDTFDAGPLAFAGSTPGGFTPLANDTS